MAQDQIVRDKYLGKNFKLDKMNKPKISQNIEQGLSLSPQQLIRANILQLNSTILEARLYQELEFNPALEISENETEHEDNIFEDSQEDNSIDFNDEDYDNWNTSPKEKKILI